MANNISVKDSSGVTQVVKTTEVSSVHTPHQNAQLQVGGQGVTNLNPVPVSDAGGSLTVDGTVSISGPVTVTGTVATTETRSGGVVDASTTRVTLATDSPGVTSLSNLSSASGLPADVVASSDTGTFSIIALIKRGMQNWTTLLGRVPTLVSGRIPVDGSEVTQPVSLASAPLPTGAATETTLAAINTKVPTVGQKTMAASWPVVIASDQSAVSVSGTVSTGGLTDTQLRASAVPVSGTVSTGGLTDTQLRASAVPVSGPLTDTQLRSSSVPVLSAGYTTLISATKTRPADTVTYASGDVINESTTVGTNWTFTSCARVNQGTGTIRGVILQDSANQTLKLAAELWLFNVAPGTDNDNTVFTPTDGELDTLVAIIPLSTPYVGDGTAAAGGNSVLIANNLDEVFRCAAASTTLFGVLVARNAYVPVSAGVLRITLKIYQD
jgi:hypothetical protein